MAQDHEHDSESSPLPALLQLPPEMLHKIASFVDSGGLVVAIYGAKEPGDAGQKSRAAVRGGVDVAERARFGGWPGLTIAEAQALLNNTGHIPYLQSFLSSPVMAGTFLARTIGDHTRRRAPHIDLGSFLANMLAYGAKPDVVIDIFGSVTWTPLHHAAAGATRQHYHRAVEMLLAAGHPVDALLGGTSACTPLAVVFTALFLFWEHWDAASILVQEGMDPEGAHARHLIPPRDRQYKEHILSARTLINHGASIPLALDGYHTGCLLARLDEMHYPRMEGGREMPTNILELLANVQRELGPAFDFPEWSAWLVDVRREVIGDFRALRIA